MSQGSEFIDEDGEKFLECKSSIDEQAIHEETTVEKTQEGTNKNLFKIKNTKGKVVYDQQTKQRRFMSPFDQFLAEQQELFKKNDAENDEQNSVTLTTTASTNFGEIKVGTNSIEETAVETVKKPKVLQSTNKLA